ncbi:MAG TPA: hypothetical protein VFC03_23600 [Acidimicrobiales bacterium]|nr:hypothetical protein [Acidimicrobiales bacterium]
MTSLGLSLGAGAVVGQAYHSGVPAARRLERDGSVVVRVEPDTHTIDAMGLRPMAEDRPACPARPARPALVAEAAGQETARRITRGRFPGLDRKALEAPTAAERASGALRRLRPAP